MITVGPSRGLAVTVGPAESQGTRPGPAGTPAKKKEEQTLENLGGHDPVTELSLPSLPSSHSFVHIFLSESAS